MPSAPDLVTAAEPLPLPPTPRRARLARGSLPPPGRVVTAPAEWLELPPLSAWGPVEPVAVRPPATRDRLALSLVGALAAVAALLTVALAI